MFNDKAEQNPLSIPFTSFILQRAPLNVPEEKRAEWLFSLNTVHQMLTTSFLITHLNQIARGIQKALQKRCIPHSSRQRGLGKERQGEEKAAHRGHCSNRSTSPGSELGQ